MKRLLLLAAIALLLAGCAQQQALPPQATPTPAPVIAVATPFPTPVPTLPPDIAKALNESDGLDEALADLDALGTNSSD